MARRQAVTGLGQGYENPVEVQLEHRLLVEPGPRLDKSALGQDLGRKSFAQRGVVELLDPAGEIHVVVCPIRPEFASRVWILYQWPRDWRATAEAGRSTANVIRTRRQLDGRRRSGPRLRGPVDVDPEWSRPTRVPTARDCWPRNPARLALYLYAFCREVSVVKRVIVALAFVASGAIVGLQQGGGGWSVTTWSIIGLLVGLPVLYRRRARPPS